MSDINEMLFDSIEKMRALIKRMDMLETTDSWKQMYYKEKDEKNQAIKLTEEMVKRGRNWMLCAKELKKKLEEEKRSGLLKEIHDNVSNRNIPGILFLSHERKEYHGGVKVRISKVEKDRTPIDKN